MGIMMENSLITKKNYLLIYASLSLQEKKRIPLHA